MTAQEGNEFTLPPDVMAQVDKSIADGVFLQPKQEDDLEFSVIEAIVWRPGDHNELARTIIEYCDKPMDLDLDGRRFRISPVEKADDNHG